MITKSFHINLEQYYSFKYEINFEEGNCFGIH